MTFYPVPQNPYRASTGSMPIRVPHSPNRSKFEETCDSCGSSYTDEHLLPLNTPFSGTPTASAASLHPPSPHAQHSHRRRVSNAEIEPGKVLTRYHNGAIMLEPATSSYGTHGGDRRRRSSISAPSPASVPRSHARKSWASYQQEIDITQDDAVRRGTTRFPRKLVNKEAVQELGLPYEEDRSGSIVVLRALPRSEIEHLVELTATIRSRRSHSHSHHKHTEKHVEKHVRIITSPTETIEHPDAHHRHRRGSVSGPASTVVHHYVDPRHSSQRLSRAEEEAAAAADKARRREYRAETSGNWLDGRRAAKAREEAEDKARVFDEVSRKERRTKEVIIVR